MKTKNLKIGVVAVLSTVAAAQSCGLRSKHRSDNVKTGEIKLNEDSLRLERRLIELSETKYEGEIFLSAMCYVVGADPSVDYICPNCGDTTKYTWTYVDLYEIKKVKELVSQIRAKGYDAVLDETEYCEHCGGEKREQPVLIFKFRFSENADYHVIKSNIESDYMCLLHFISGNDSFPDPMGYKFGIHDNIRRIQKMTGLGKDLKIEKR